MPLMLFLPRDILQGIGDNLAQMDGNSEAPRAMRFWRSFGSPLAPRFASEKRIFMPIFHDAARRAKRVSIALQYFMPNQSQKLSHRP